MGSRRKEKPNKRERGQKRQGGKHPENNTEWRCRLLVSGYSVLGALLPPSSPRFHANSNSNNNSCHPGHQSLEIPMQTLPVVSDQTATHRVYQ